MAIATLEAAPASLNLSDCEQAFSAALGVPIRVAAWRAWASITFDGFRVMLDRRDEIDAATLAALPEIDFRIPGYVVADIEATGPHRFDALLVRDR